MQQSGHMRLVSSEEADRLEAADQPPRASLDTVDPEQAKEAMRRLSYVRAWNAAGRPSRTVHAIADLVAEEARRRKEVAPSARSVLRWIRDWLLHGEDPEMLVPQISRRGYRRDALAPKVREILKKTVVTHWLTEQNLPVTAVHALVVKAFEDHNEGLPAEDHLVAPSLDSVYRECRRIDAFTRDFCREGKHAARQRWRPVGSGPVVTRHNEVWEIDHSWVDAIVVDEDSGLPIGRPLVTSVIDRGTRAVMFVCIGFDHPSTEVVFDAMTGAILPKDDLLASVPGIAGKWPCFGVPAVLVPDQGREFKSRAFREACHLLNIDVQYTPVLKAWYKGIVERFLGTLARQVFHRVPGTVFNDFYLRRDKTPPEKVAVVTLDELRDHVVRWIVDIYMPRKHRTLGISPLEAWNASVAEHGGVPLPPAPAELARILTPVAWPTPQRYGVEFEGLIFNSPDLADLRVRLGKPTPVKVVINRFDLSRVAVVDPDTGRPIEATIQGAMNGKAAGLTLRKHRKARALQRENPGKFGGDKGVLLAHAAIDEAMQKKSAGNGLDNLRKAAAYREEMLRAAPAAEDPEFDVEASAASLATDETGAAGPPANEIAEAEAAWAEARRAKDD
uniref:DDE-type integrase/transposase/recombinase n=1 Tax=Falsiroseomonas oryziterrae TaxID=2911368 RepID=UPI001F021E0F